MIDGYFEEDGQIDTCGNKQNNVKTDARRSWQAIIKFANSKPWGGEIPERNIQRYPIGIYCVSADR